MFILLAVGSFLMGFGLALHFAEWKTRKEDEIAFQMLGEAIRRHHEKKEKEKSDEG